MTAIGLLLLVIGFALSRMFGVDLVEYAFTRRTNVWDAIGGVMILVGALLALAGIGTFLWRVMP